MERRESEKFKVGPEFYRERRDPPPLQFGRLLILYDYARPSLSVSPFSPLANAASTTVTESTATN